MKVIQELMKITSSKDPQFVELESNYEALQKKFDNLFTLLHNNLDEFGRNYTAKEEEMRNEIEKLKEGIIKEKNHKNFLLNIIDDIDYRRFEEARVKLKSIENFQDFQHIVKKVYNSHRSDSFKLIMDFTSGISDLSKYIQMLKALKIEVEMRNHLDGDKIVQLIIAFEIIELAWDVPMDIQQEVEGIIQEIIQQVISTLRIELASNRTQFSDESVERLNEIYSLNEPLVKEIIQETIKNVTSDKVSQTLDCLWFEEYYDLNAIGAIAMYEKLTTDGDLNNSALFKLAYHIKALLPNKFSSFTIDYKTDLQNIKMKLPKSVKYIVFHEWVRIKNYCFDEYLYVAGTDIDSCKSLFTWHDDIDISDYEKFKFYFINYDQEFTIKNVHFSSYPLAPASIKNGKRKVCADRYKPGDRWYLEPFGDYLRIKNSLGNGHLYANYTKRDDARRRVYSGTSEDGAMECDIWIVS